VQALLQKTSSVCFWTCIEQGNTRQSFIGDCHLFAQLIEAGRYPERVLGNPVGFFK
jgi:hypothetical protein